MLSLLALISKYRCLHFNLACPEVCVISSHLAFMKSFFGTSVDICVTFSLLIQIFNFLPSRNRGGWANLPVLCPMSMWKGNGECFKREKRGSGSNIPPEALTPGGDGWLRWHHREWHNSGTAVFTGDLWGWSVPNPASCAGSGLLQLVSLGADTHPHKAPFNVARKRPLMCFIFKFLARLLFHCLHKCALITEFSVAFPYFMYLEKLPCSLRPVVCSTHLLPWQHDHTILNSLNFKKLR